jgi:hypothetical protein
MAASQGQQLLPGERIVSSTDLITLTNYRVFRDSGGSGQTRYVSITLDAVSSCGLITSSQPVLLILGLIAVISGIAAPGDAQAALIITGAVLIIMYFATLSAVVAICSTGGERITVPAKASQRPLLMTLVNAIDREKLAALGRIGTGQHVDATAIPPPMASVRAQGPSGTW